MKVGALARPKFLVTVFDSLRPDMIGPELMPTLAAFLGTGCRYPSARAVFPSETRVNTATIATGAHPGGHGIVANVYHDPALPDGLPFNTAKADRLAAALKAHGPNLVSVPALGDLLAGSGLTFAAISAGSPGNARFINPRAEALGQATYSVHGAGASSPAARYDDVVARFGPPPAAAIPNLARCRYATDVLLGTILKEPLPDVALIWYSEPDISYHYRGVGSPESQAAITGVDRELARILDWWRASPEHDRIQIAVLSDHGQVMARERLDVVAAMRQAGFRVGERLEPDVDYVCVAASSGNVFVRDGAPRRIARLVYWLQERPWCGLLFTAGRNAVEGAVPGSFAHRLVRATHGRAPHIFYTLAADDAVNPFGLDGTCFYWAGDVPEGGGVHGGLHRRELAVLMGFAGSGFHVGAEPPAPAGLADVAPMILHALGLAIPASMTGRVLREAFVGGSQASDISAATLEASHGAYCQSLATSAVAGQIYLDGGTRSPTK